MGGERTSEHLGRITTKKMKERKSDLGIHSFLHDNSIICCLSFKVHLLFVFKLPFHCSFLSSVPLFFLLLLSFLLLFLIWFCLRRCPSPHFLFLFLFFSVLVCLFICKMYSSYVATFLVLALALFIPLFTNLFYL